MRAPAALMACVFLVTAVVTSADASPRSRRAASEAKSQVVVMQFRGARARAVRNATLDALKREVELVPEKRASAAARKAKSSLARSKGRVAAGRELGVCCIIAGRITRQGGRFNATITLYQASDGAEIKSFTVTERRATRLPDAVKKRIMPELGEGMARATRAARSAASARAKKDKAAKDGADKAKARRGKDGDKAGKDSRARPAARGKGRTDGDEASSRDTSWRADVTRSSRLDIVAYGRPFFRQLSYNDDIMEALRSYEIAAPAIGAGAVYFPAKKGIWRHTGIEIGGEHTVATTSQNAAGEIFPTSSFELQLGGQARVPLGSVLVTLAAGYGLHHFAINESELGRDPGVPAVSYHYLRGGMSVAYTAKPRVTVHAILGWRHLLSTGELQSDDWFPRLTGAGIDSRLGVSYQLAAGLSAHILADLRRYFFAMNPELGDALIAGGAIDQYIAITLGFGWRWPG